jgi:excisionase family DNA binding protein
MGANRPVETPPRLLTADEISELLQVSASHIYHLAQTGAIPSVRVGRAVRFELGPVLEATRQVPA